MNNQPPDNRGNPGDRGRDRSPGRPRLSRDIGEHIRHCSLKPRTNFLSGFSERYSFELAVDETMRLKTRLNKRIAIDLVFRTAKLQQIDFKAEQLVGLGDALGHDDLRNAEVDLDEVVDGDLRGVGDAGGGG